MDNKHVKLCGGSINTAKHDLERMRTAKAAVKGEVAAQKERSKTRKEEQSNDFSGWEYWDE